MTNILYRALIDELHDMYPKPGTCIKQWVIDTRDRARWCADTCPIVHVTYHRDNTDTLCRNVGRTPWLNLNHDYCYVCNDLRDIHSGDLDIAAWQIAWALLPPICEDHNKLSGEVAPFIDFDSLSRTFSILTKR